jgi:hypothetical protein
MNGQKEVLPTAIEELQATNRSLDTEAGMVVVFESNLRGSINDRCGPD